MDPTAADDAPEVAVADQSAAEARRGDPLYRRPPAHPPIETTTSGSWFTGGTDVSEPASAEFAEPDYGPAPPATSSRASFGFTAGPISPVRSSGPDAVRSPGGSDAVRSPGGSDAVRSPGGSDAVRSPAGYDAPTGSRKRQTGARTGAQQPESQRGSTGRQAASQADSQSRDAAAAASPTGELPLRRRGPSRQAPPAPPAPAARQAAPSSLTWAQTSFTDEQSTLDRAPSGGALRDPSGEYATAWLDSDSTGERRLARREAPPEVVPRTARQSRFVTAGIALLSAIVLVGGAAVGVVYFTGSNDGVDSVLELGAGGAAKRTVTAPLDNRTKATFELLAGANAVNVTIGELGDDLYRISTPDDAGFRPSPVLRNDDVKLQVTQDGDGTGGEIEVVLAAKVRWALRFSGYAETQVVDVSGGQVSQIEMVAGMRRAEVTLARPTGTVPLKINGAVETLILKSPASSPVRIKVGGGAQTVVAGSRTLKDVAAGSTLTPKGWDTANRYDVTAGARITTLTIESA